MTIVIITYIILIYINIIAIIQYCIGISVTNCVRI